MPYTLRIDCPECDRPLVHKRGGRCPHCNAPITEHVARERHRERRIEQTVAIIATVLVLALFAWGGGLGLIEGVVIYAVVGVGVWYWGKGTFWSARLDDDEPEPEDRES